jgi:hypothetical protein
VIPSPNIDIRINPFAEVFWIFFWAVIVAAFAMVLSLFLQPQIQRTGDVIITQPLMTGAIGLLAFVIAAILFLTIIPPLLVAFAWLFGVVALGSQVGERFSKAVNQVWSPVLTVGFGTFLLMLVGGAIGLGSLSGRPDALPAGYGRNRRLGHHLVRDTPPPGAGHDCLHSSHRFRRGTARRVGLKSSHVIINPPRQTGAD